LKNELAIFSSSKIKEKFKPEYGFLLNQKYFQYTNYENIKIQSTLSNLLMYNLEINFSKILLLQFA
jgi:hypothetical protein